jgi:hypothetical protein
MFIKVTRAVREYPVITLTAVGVSALVAKLYASRSLYDKTYADFNQARANEIMRTK